MSNNNHPEDLERGDFAPAVDELIELRQRMVQPCSPETLQRFKKKSKPIFVCYYQEKNCLCDRPQNK